MLAEGSVTAYVGEQGPTVNQSSEPIFNIPGVVLAITSLMVAVHVGRVFLFGIGSPDDRLLVLAWFAFVTDRYVSDPFGMSPFPGGLGADIWTFATYALLHADFMHLAMNSLWFVAFGTPVARRFGPLRFVLFFVVTAAAGAATFLIANGESGAVMIGASAAASGMMAAAMRFAFQPDGPIALWRQGDDRASLVPALPLVSALRDPRIFAFLVIWFGLNLLFGLGSLSLFGNGQPVAWEAHIGGFLAGLVLFSAFDPVPPAAGREHAGENMPQ